MIQLNLIQLNLIQLSLIQLNLIQLSLIQLNLVQLNLIQLNLIQLNLIQLNLIQPNLKFQTSVPVASTLTQLESLKVLRKALGRGWGALEACQMEIGLTTVEFLSSTKQQSSLLLIV